jgi:hypothetical protein
MAGISRRSLSNDDFQTYDVWFASFIARAAGRPPSLPWPRGAAGGGGRNA